MSLVQLPFPFMLCKSKVAESRETARIVSELYLDNPFSQGPQTEAPMSSKGNQSPWSSVVATPLFLPHQVVTRRRKTISHILSQIFGCSHCLDATLLDRAAQVTPS